MTALAVLAIGAPASADGGSGTATLTLEEYANLTLVATKKAPKLLVFDNIELGTLPEPAGHFRAFYAYRNASDLGGINIYAGSVGSQGPAAPALFEKGDQAAGFDFDGGLRAILATYPEETDAIAGSVAVAFRRFRRHELMVVGTTPKNARIVKTLRGVVAN